jgi:hypothetical protein
LHGNFHKDGKGDVEIHNEATPAQPCLETFQTNPSRAVCRPQNDESPAG